MSDISVEEEEVIVIDIESNIADDNNINAAPRADAGGDPLDSNGNDDATVGGHKRGRQGSDLGVSTLMTLTRTNTSWPFVNIVACS
jgi:hypothetical protein